MVKTEIIRHIFQAHTLLLFKLIISIYYNSIIVKSISKMEELWSKGVRRFCKYDGEFTFLAEKCV